jgi:hypothetical protein
VMLEQVEDRGAGDRGKFASAQAWRWNGLWL